MKSKLLLLIPIWLLAACLAQASDLPTDTTLEHLYYLRTRATYLSKLRPDEMIEYCVALKLGSQAFADLYAQTFALRVEIAKLQQVDGVGEDDLHLKTLNKTYDAYFRLLRDDAQRTQNALVREGQIASNTLDAIARDQK